MLNLLDSLRRVNLIDGDLVFDILELTDNLANIFALNVVTDLYGLHWTALDLPLRAKLVVLQVYLWSFNLFDWLWNTMMFFASASEFLGIILRYLEAIETATQHPAEVCHHIPILLIL